MRIAAPQWPPAITHARTQASEQPHAKHAHSSVLGSRKHPGSIAFVRWRTLDTRRYRWSDSNGRYNPIAGTLQWLLLLLLLVLLVRTLRRCSSTDLGSELLGLGVQTHIGRSELTQLSRDAPTKGTVDLRGDQRERQWRGRCRGRSGCRRRGRRVGRYMQPWQEDALARSTRQGGGGSFVGIG